MSQSSESPQLASSAAPSSPQPTSNNNHNNSSSSHCQPNLTASLVYKSPITPQKSPIAPPKSPIAPQKPPIAPPKSPIPTKAKSSPSRPETPLRSNSRPETPSNKHKVNSDTSNLNNHNFQQQIPGQDPRLKSKKFLNQWKQAASMSKLGNRTRNLLGKWKSHSQSVDVVGSGGVLDGVSNAGPSVSGVGLSGSAGQVAHGNVGSDPGSVINVEETSKAKWSEHVWSKLKLLCNILYTIFE